MKASKIILALVLICGIGGVARDHPARPRERLDIRRRRNRVEDGAFFEDAMIEFHALAVNG